MLRRPGGDAPPLEVLAAGLTRCIIPIRCEHRDEWLHPDPKNLFASMAILDDSIDAYYQWNLSPQNRVLEDDSTEY